MDKGNSEKNEQSAKTLEGVDLNIPLSYADRFRIRKPGKWDSKLYIAHVDGECHTLLLTRLLLNQDTHRRIDREMGRSVLQEMF